MSYTTKERAKIVYRGIWQVLITGIILFPFIYVWEHSLNVLLDRQYLNKGNILMWGVYLVLLILFLYVLGGYHIGRQKKSNLIISQTMGLFCTNSMEVVLTVLMVGRVKYIDEIVWGYVKLSVVQVALLFVLSVLGIDLYRKIFPPYRMLQIYGTHINKLSDKMNARGDKYHIEGKISCEEDLSVISREIERYDAVLINDVPSEKRNKILKVCFEQSRRVYFTPKISDIIVKSSDELNLFDTPLYYCRNQGMSVSQRFIKRLIDMIVALVGILITSPIMLVTAIAIYAYDRGPVFYRQTRCTIGGKEFRIFKFRSMITNAEKDGKARLATEHDNRITPVGRVIRAARIDELPQFFNILAGDMSVVGPRPERPEILREYCREVPEFAYRLRVKAGLTGYAQVFGKYNTTSYDKLKLDLIYVNKCSVLMDIRLILLTLKVIFLKDSTEGLDEGNTTAATKTKERN